MRSPFARAALLAALALLSGCGRIREFRDVRRLKEQATDFRTVYEPVLGPGLVESQSGVSWAEYLTFARMEKAESVESLAYFNRYEEVRWARDGRHFGLEIDDYKGRAPVSTAALDEVYRTTSTVVIADPGGRYDVYIPIFWKSAVQGVVEIRCPADGIADLVSRSGDFIEIPRASPLKAKSDGWAHIALQSYTDGIISLRLGHREMARRKFEWSRRNSIEFGNPRAALAWMDRADRP